LLPRSAAGAAGLERMARLFVVRIFAGHRGILPPASENENSIFEEFHPRGWRGLTRMGCAFQSVLLSRRW
jgi:hypothetical protein